MKKTDKRPLTIKRVSFLLVFLAALLLTTAYAAGNQPAGAAVDPVDRSDNYSAVMYDNSKVYGQKRSDIQLHGYFLLL